MKDFISDIKKIREQARKHMEAGAVTEGYKANREPAPPELKRQFVLCREFCRCLGVPEFASTDYEADDLIGTLAARVRAIEEGLAVARAANTGISAVIDPNGRIIAALDLGRAGVVDARLPQALAATPYARFGDFGFGALLMLCAGLSWALARRARPL